MTASNRILIFSGGHLGTWALQELQPGDFLLGVDRGAVFLLQQGLQPDYAIGDFDSVTPEEFAQIKEQSKDVWSCDPIQKNETDTEMALNWALEQRPGEIVLFGVLGNRFDHSLANVHLLTKALKSGIPCYIVDEKNEILLIDKTTFIKKNRFPQISLLPLTSKVTGITLKGFQYPLQQATLTIGNSLGISNVLQEETGTIELAEGQLLVIKSAD